MTSVFRRKEREPIGRGPTGSLIVTNSSGTETSYSDDNLTMDYMEDYTSMTYGPFVSTKTSISGSYINGRYYDGLTEAFYNNIPSGSRSNWFNYESGLAPDDGYLRTATLAKTNPNVPRMSIPNALFELREIPDLIRSFGNEAINIMAKNVSIKTVANLNLAVQFGIAPMVSDIMTCLEFAKNVDNRLKNLASVKKYGGINKTKRLGKYVSARSTLSYYWGGPVFLPYEELTVTEEEIWGISNWRLDPTFAGTLYNSNFTKGDMMQEGLTKLIGLTGSSVTKDELNAFRAAYGLYSYGINDLWNILPFSWLVDYFANIGDIADANDNRLGLYPHSAALCKHSRVTRTHPEATNWNGVTLSPGSFKGERKYRSPIDIPSARSAMTLKVPMISQNQMGILGSLFVTRARSQHGKSTSLQNPYLSWAHRVSAGISQNSYLFTG